MNKKIIAILILLFSQFSVTRAEALDCPYGFVNDPAPGNCNLYRDFNNNGYCDLSEVEKSVAEQSVTATDDLMDLITGKELKTKTVSEAADLYQLDADLVARELTVLIKQSVRTSDSFQLLHDNYGLSPDAAKELLVALKTGQQTKVVEVQEVRQQYYMWQITVVILAFYLFSLVLVKKKKISPAANKKIWNLLLLISFVVTAFTSILVLLRLNYSLTVYFPLNVVYWHIEIGYAMILIALCHTLWHWPYFKAYFK